MEVYCEMEDYKLIDEHSRPAADRKERQEHHNMRETRFWAVAVFIMAFVFLLTAAICFAMGAAESTLLREILLEFLAKCLTTILLPCAIAQGK